MQLNPARNLAAAVAVAVTAAGILAMNVPFINGAVKNLAYSALSPLQRGMWMASANAGGVFKSLSMMNSAAEENERLRLRINELAAQNSQIEGLKKENENLRQSLNLELQKDFDLKLADIIGKHPGTDTLVINKGSDDMVEAGQPVITAQKALVGRVSRVYGRFSEVKMITEKDFSFDVKIGADNVNGLAKGRGGFEIMADLVPKDKELKTQDIVATSVLGGIFPPGLLVGTVENVNKNDVGSFQAASISLAFDPGRDHQVFVASGKSPEGITPVADAPKN